MEQVTPLQPGLYQHYKGPLYRVLHLAQHSEEPQTLVIYQALYGEKGLWARPLTMFTEMVEHDDQQIPRFKYCESQSAVLEVAILDVQDSKTTEFELAFKQAETILRSMRGYLSHQLKQCLEQPNRYLLLVDWQSLEDHTEGFRGSAQYQQWRDLLHHFYQPMPIVEHYR